MSVCKSCGKEIVWAYDRRRSKWCSINPKSTTGDDEAFEGGVLFRRGHVYHQCRKYSTPTKHSVALVQAYAALYLLPSAPHEIVRAAYRALAHVHHPDSGGDHSRMVEINRAYETIKGGGR